jgi:hypothetical protein
VKGKWRVRRLLWRLPEIRANGLRRVSIFAPCELCWGGRNPYSLTFIALIFGFGAELSLELSDDEARKLAEAEMRESE